MVEISSANFLSVITSSNELVVIRLNSVSITQTTSLQMASYNI